MKKKLLNYFTPALLAVLVFLSNFLSTELFRAGFQNFSVWFILSLFIFVCGWLIDKIMGWRFGGKVVFSVVVGTTILAVTLIIFLNQYFGMNEILTENLILYSLRNITLGSIAFFGMAVAEVLILQKEVAVFKNNKQPDLDEKELAHKEALLIINNAKLEADKMLFEADKKQNEIITKKNKLENQLREFISVEREIISKYEKEFE